MEQFRKRNRLSDKQKIFIISANYTVVKDALKERDWFRNKDKQSPFFHLKWVVKAKDIDYNNLKDYQIVNHFDRGTEITSKWGLCKNLKSMIWYSAADVNTFFPR